MSSWQWSRAAVEALDADAIRAAMPSPPMPSAWWRWRVRRAVRA
ncbi:hypothetical protein [Streptomyces pseudoechinosporeus]